LGEKIKREGREYELGETERERKKSFVRGGEGGMWCLIFLRSYIITNYKKIRPKK